MPLGRRRSSTCSPASTGPTPAPGVSIAPRSSAIDARPTATVRPVGSFSNSCCWSGGRPDRSTACVGLRYRTVVRAPAAPSSHSSMVLAPTSPSDAPAPTTTNAMNSPGRLLSDGTIAIAAASATSDTANTRCPTNRSNSRSRRRCAAATRCSGIAPSVMARAVRRCQAGSARDRPARPRRRSGRTVGRTC